VEVAYDDSELSEEGAEEIEYGVSNGMSLANAIARVDRRMKGEPTPSKEGTPPDVSSKRRDSKD
jgi:hypothetical protein